MVMRTIWGVSPPAAGGRKPRWARRGNGRGAAIKPWEASGPGSGRVLGAGMAFGAGGGAIIRPLVSDAGRGGMSSKLAGDAVARVGEASPVMISWRVAVASIEIMAGTTGSPLGGRGRIRCKPWS